MTPAARAAALLSLTTFCVSCEDSSDQQSTANTQATTTLTTSSTTGSPSPSAGTAATTEATASASSVSTTTASSSSSSGSGGASSSTSGTSGIGGAAGETSDTVTGTTGGSSGTTSDSTTTGGTSEGELVLADACPHEACDGDLANTSWSHTRACVLKEQLIGPIQSFCPSITLVGSSGMVGGTIAFEGTTYDQTVNFLFSIELDVPAECDITCTSFASTLAVMGFPDATCTESSAVCHCTGSAHGTDQRSGDYTADDGTLAFVYPYGTIEASYCVGADGSLSYRVPVNLVPQGTPMDVVYEAVPQ